MYIAYQVVLEGRSVLGVVGDQDVARLEGAHRHDDLRDGGWLCQFALETKKKAEDGSV